MIAELEPETIRITAAIETISPADAEAILGHNVHNRHVRPSRVQRYARDMRNHEWLLNGETIKISDTGKLLDGQHRLLGVIESGVPARFVVVRGLPDQTQETVDIGDKRSLGDTLMLRGEKSHNNVAAAVMTAYRVTHRVMGRSDVWPTNQELLDYFDTHQDIRDSLVWSHKATSNPLKYPPSQAVALHYLMKKVGSVEEADRFWESLFVGTGLDEGSPILTLRNFLLRELGETRRRSTVAYRIAVTIKAWNAVRDERAMQIARWVSGTEAFPVPH